MIIEAKVFQSGNSQAIRIPKELRVKTDKVFIKQVKNELLIIPNEDIWENWWNSFDAIDLKREQGSQKREEIF
jgi:antitoxin VapB